MLTTKRRLGAAAAALIAAVVLTGCPGSPPPAEDDVDTGLPPAPNGLQLQRTGATVGHVAFSWVPIAAAEAYQFRFRATGPDAGHEEIIQAPASSAGFSSAAFILWAHYELNVRIRVDGVWSHWSWAHSFHVCSIPQLSC
jgi:hypothetical protein